MNEKQNETPIKKKGKAWVTFVVGLLLGIILTVIAMETYEEEIAPLDMRDYENTDILIATKEKSSNPSNERFLHSPEMPTENERFLQKTDFTDDGMLISADLFS